MYYTQILFFTQYINTLFTLEELPLLFKKLNSKECKKFLNVATDIKETLAIIPNEINFIESYTQTQNIIDNSIPTNIHLENYKKQSVTVYEKHLPTIPFEVAVETPQTTLQTNVANSRGKASFYFRIGDDKPGCPSVQTFNDGNFYGPCNNGEGIKYNGNSESKYWVAIKNAEINCGKTITINYQSNSIKLKVMDKCPGCSDSDVDMSLDALIELTGSIEKACSINTTPPMISWNFN